MNKKIFILFVILLSCHLKTKSQSYQSNGGWQLVFDNEFNATSLNDIIPDEVWNKIPDGSGYVFDGMLDHTFNASKNSDAVFNEYMCLSTRNSFSTNNNYQNGISIRSLGVNSGRLPYGYTDYAKCSVSPPPADGISNYRAWNYEGGFLTTKKKYLYGKFEIKFKINNVVGYRPVFWLWGGNTQEYREVDVCEFNTDDLYSLPMHIHTNSPIAMDGKNETMLTKQGCAWSDDWIYMGGGVWIQFDFTTWNTITFYWEPNRLEIAVNGLIVWNIDTQNDEVKWKDCGHFNWSCMCSTCTKFSLSGLPFNVPMNVVLENRTYNTPSNHPILNDPSSNFEIDYLKIWQRLDCNQDLNVNQWTVGNSEYLGRNVMFNAPTSWVDAQGNGQCLCPWPGQPCAASNNLIMGNSQYIDAYYTDSWHATNEFQTQSQANGMNLRVHQVPCTSYSQYRTSNDEPTKDITMLMPLWDKAGIKYTIRNTPPPPKNITDNKGRIEENNVTIAPNPFSQSTILEFDIIKTETNVQITLYNMMGQQVKEIAHYQTLTEGMHQYDITRDNLPSGIYQLQLKTESGIINKQIVIQ